LNFSYGLAKFLGNFAYHILRLRRRVVMDNLQTAFGREKAESQIEVIAAESYRQIGMSFVELLVAPKLHPQIQHILEPKHFSLIQRLLHGGKGLITVSGHLGNWELQGAAAATAMSKPFTVAAVQQSNPYIDRFITRRRNDMGMQVAGTKEAMKLLLRALKNRQAIGLVADQNAGRNAVFVDFFGKKAATQPGPAQLALKFGATGRCSDSNRPREIQDPLPAGGNQSRRHRGNPHPAACENPRGFYPPAPGAVFLAPPKMEDETAWGIEDLRN
jgi:KDO2-lipid IV(A) lauroyltransferase